MKTPLIFDIAENSYVDGPGIRTTVFLKGCNLRCLWCHNPESQSPEAEMMFYPAKCTGCGTCKSKCPHQARPTECTHCGLCENYCPTDARHIAGVSMSIEKIMQRIRSDIPFYGSDGGVTVSGGECMLYPDFVFDLLSKCREEGIGTVVDTAGAVPFSSFEKVLPVTDLFLFDIKAFTPNLHKELTGIDNSLILENYKKLLAAGARVWVRIPVIPGANDQDVINISRFLSKYPPEKTELLPYHKLGENKYRAIGKEPKTYSAPSETEMEQLRSLFK